MPGATATYCEQLNNKGQVAIAYVDSSGLQHGAVYDSKSARYIFPIDEPGQAETFIIGITDKQTIAGGSMTTGTSNSEGFRAAGRLQ